MAWLYNKSLRQLFIMQQRRKHRRIMRQGSGYRLQRLKYSVRYMKGKWIECKQLQQQNEQRIKNYD